MSLKSSDWGVKMDRVTLYLDCVSLHQCVWKNLNNMKIMEKIKSESFNVEEIVDV